MAALPDASQRLESSASSDLLYHMALLQTWQQVWRRGCTVQYTGSGLYGVKERKAPCQGYISEAPFQSPEAPALSDIVFKLMLPSNEISLSAVLPSNKISLWEETAESLVLRSQWHTSCNQRTPLSASQLPTASGLTFMSNISSEPQIPSRCGDVITSHSTYRRAMQRAHSLVLEREEGRSGAVNSGNLLGEVFFYRRLLF